MQCKIPQLEFIKFSGLDITKKLSNCLLVYDDSCDEIFNDKEFVKIATSGRHRKLHVIYVKHNLFQQSKWSRTIDLNTTHIILFKSLRDIQQIEYLGKQLNCLQLLKDAYKLATAQPYGHLIVDLIRKQVKPYNFLLNFLVPNRQFSIFLRRKPLLHQLRMKKRHLLMLKRWCVSSYPKSSGKRIFLAQDIDFIWFLSDCVERPLWCCLNQQKGTAKNSNPNFDNFQKNILTHYKEVSFSKQRAGILSFD